MARENSVSRRTALKLTGAAASAALVAGCGGDGGNGNGNGNGNGDSEGPFEIDPDTDIELRSLSSSWEGMAPSEIEGVENPDLSLQEGETYTIIWAENEQGNHNLAIYDDSQSEVEGPTDETDEEEPDQELEFEASEETVEYVCIPHYNTGMAGNIELQ